MAQVKDIEQLAIDIWLYLADNPSDTASLGAAEDAVRAGTMTLVQAQAHEFSNILVEE